MDQNSRTEWFIVVLFFVGAFLGGFCGSKGYEAVATRLSAKPEAPKMMLPNIKFAIAPDGQPVAVGTNWTFFAADYDGDGIPDLWVIKQANTGTHSTEVHVLKGPTFQEWILHCGTPLEETPGYITVGPKLQAEKP